MAFIASKRFVPTEAEAEKGAQPMDKAEIIAALQAYKKQNPVKYAAKKEALFKKYGLNEELPEEQPDVEDIELEEKAKKVTKKQNAK